MYTRGKFGIEYKSGPSGWPSGRPPRDAPRGWWPWLLGLLAVCTLVSFCHTTVKRLRSRDAESAAAVPPDVPAPRPEPAVAPPAPSVRPKPAAVPPAAPVVVDTRRPARVSTLLMRLDEAERQRNEPLAASAIEQLLALPGNPVADLEDKLRRRLGNLNRNALFGRRSGIWIADVTVKRGDAPLRIAREYASTYASLVKLNGEKTLEKLRPGQKLKVLNKPRFNLVVHRRMRIADLELNGKFFRRYDLTEAVTGAPGVYAVNDRLRTVLSAQGISFRPDDRAELELLVPAGATVLISEL